MAGNELPDPSDKRNASMATQISMAMELPLTLIIGVLIGGGAGYFVDKWAHTGSIFLLVGGLLGFAGSMVEILRRLSGSERKEKRDT